MIIQAGEYQIDSVIPALFYRGEKIREGITVLQIKKQLQDSGYLWTKCLEINSRGYYSGREEGTPVYSRDEELF